MASRRAPLADVPNAVNSPFRTIAAGSGKRTRAQAGELREGVYGQPPTKRQAIAIPGTDGENLDPAYKYVVPVTTKDRLDEPFAKRSNPAPPTAFEKKLASVRERKPATSQQRNDRPHKTPASGNSQVERPQGDSLDSVKQWQKHYRRQFPIFVFYFESVPEDVRVKAMRQINSLGARVEKFFSKSVTHVVTTRTIPPEASSTSSDEDAKQASIAPRTIQPSALTQDQRRTTSLLDAQVQRRGQTTAAPAQPSVEHRKAQSNNADTLLRARVFGMRIWALEKLQRVLSTILETDTVDGSISDHRNQTTGSRHITKPAQHADLEQLLRHEKVNGPADRDMTVVTQDMVTLRGCFLYIHDMDERTKPTMAREYNKPDNREDGKWPQFRLTPAGRCPFIEDAAYKKKLSQQEREAEAKQEYAPRPKGSNATLQPALSQALAEREPNLRRSPRKIVQDSKSAPRGCFDPPQDIPVKRQSSAANMPPLFGSAQVSLRGLPRMVAGEPVASGIQPSNVTSAIRSQVISSAAISSTAPGFNRRVGDTKEVSMLKRKLLERGPSSYMNDVRAAINDDQGPPPRAAKRKAQETLGVVHEDGEAKASGKSSKTDAVSKKKIAEKDAKAGYCENCRDKFDDFDEVSSSGAPIPLSLLTFL